MNIHFGYFQISVCAVQTYVVGILAYFSLCLIYFVCHIINKDEIEELEDWGEAGALRGHELLSMVALLRQDRATSRFAIVAQALEKVDTRLRPMSGMLLLRLW